VNQPAANTLQAQRDYALLQLDDLKRRGRQLRHALMAEPANAPALTALRSWQQACASAIHQLAGGSKAHWLSRAYSGALLVRSADGGAIVEADVATIADRILEILEQASRSLSLMDDVAVASSSAAPPRRRFEFVHNTQLRPVLEQAFAASGEALTAGDFPLSLITSCGIIEAIITDALEQCGPRTAADGSSFAERIAAAEREGLIRRGCARLPPVALTYRDGAGTGGASVPPASITERDATLARQVLHVIMRDLDPGR
jgi:hypothetical protein